MTAQPEATVQQNFKHTIRPGWGDCDPAQIVYTGRLASFALDAIDAWWEHHLDGKGWFQLNIDDNIGTPFVNMNLDFKAPVTPRSKLVCEVWPNKLGNKSIEFRVNAFQDDQICFEGTFVCVFAIADKFEPIQPPASIRDMIEPLLPENSAK